MHCLLNPPFQIKLNIYIQDQNSIFNRQSHSRGNQKKILTKNLTKTASFKISANMPYICS